MRRAEPTGILRFSLLFPSVFFAVVVLAVAREADGQDLETVNAMVKEIAGACTTRTQMQSLTKTYGSFSVREAYTVQAAVAREMSKSLGPVVGYKVAYASKAAQAQFGMDEPASGPFCLLQRVPSGSRLPAGAFMEITLETEVAFTLGLPLDRPVKDVSELKKYVKWVHTAFDAGEYRFATGEKPKPQDMIATGVGAHCFVLGPAADLGSVDIDRVTLKLARNGKLLRQSPATNVMGSPWNSLLWLANHVVKLGGALEPGTVVLSGTAAPAYRVKGDRIKGVYVGDCGPLGRVTLTID